MPSHQGALSIDGRHTNQRRPRQPPYKKMEGWSPPLRYAKPLETSLGMQRHLKKYQNMHWKLRVCQKLPRARIHLPGPHYSMIIFVATFQDDSICYHRRAAERQHKTVPLRQYFANLFGDWQTLADPLFVIMRHYAKSVAEAMTNPEKPRWNPCNTWYASMTNWTLFSTGAPRRLLNIDRNHYRETPNPFSAALPHWTGQSKSADCRLLQTRICNS
jgi:hypothetical protein